MSPFEGKDINEILDVEDDSDFKSFLIAPSGSFMMVSRKYGDEDKKAIASTAGDFGKWLKDNHKETAFSIEKEENRLSLKSSDLWIPLIYLSNEIALPVLLNLISSYVYDKMRGALKGETQRVHLSVIFEDKKEKKTKRFNFEGDIDSLKIAISKLKLDKFLNE